MNEWRFPPVFREKKIGMKNVGKSVVFFFNSNHRKQWHSYGKRVFKLKKLPLLNRRRLYNNMSQGVCKQKVRKLSPVG